MVGQDTWDQALLDAGGNKKAAADAINQQYGLSKNNGNMYGSMSHLLAQNGPVTDENGNNILSMGSNGSILYDLDNVKSTEELVSKIAEQFGVTKDYAEALVGDMKTYSETLGADLQANDARNTFNDFLGSRLEKTGTKDGKDIFNLNASEKELKTFADAFGKTVDELKAEMEEGLTVDGKSVTIGSYDEKKKVANGYVKETTDKEGNKSYDWYDDKAKSKM
jgi:hypothetical protein